MLTGENRSKLDAIVVEMKGKNEPDERIRALVDDFKSKYDVPDTAAVAPVGTTTAVAEPAPAVPEGPGEPLPPELGGPDPTQPPPMPEPPDLGPEPVPQDVTAIPMAEPTAAELLPKAPKPIPRLEPAPEEVTQNLQKEYEEQGFRLVNKDPIEQAYIDEGMEPPAAPVMAASKAARLFHSAMTDITNAMREGLGDPVLTKNFVQHKGKAYLDKRAEIQAEKEQEARQEDISIGQTEEDILTMGAPEEAPADVTAPAPQGHPELDRLKDEGLAIREQMTPEEIQAVQGIPFGQMARELGYMAVEDGLLWFLGGAGLKGIKNLAKTAMKYGSGSTPVKRTIDLLKEAKDLRNIGQIAGETGVFLAPEAAREAELPDPGEVAGTGLAVGGLHAAGKAIKKWKPEKKEPEIPDYPPKEIRLEPRRQPEPKPKEPKEPEILLKEMSADDIARAKSGEELLRQFPERPTKQQIQDYYRDVIGEKISREQAGHTIRHTWEPAKAKAPKPEVKPPEKPVEPAKAPEKPVEPVTEKAPEAKAPETPVETKPVKEGEVDPDIIVFDRPGLKKKKKFMEKAKEATDRYKRNLKGWAKVSVGKHTEPKVEKGSLGAKAHETFMRGRKQLEENLKIKADKIWEGFMEKTVNRQHWVEKILMKTEAGRRARIDFHMSRGNSNEAKRIIDETMEKVTKLVAPEEKQLFDELIEAHRFIEVQKVMNDKNLLRALMNKSKRIDVEQGHYDLIPVKAGEPIIQKFPEGRTVKYYEDLIAQVKKNQPEVYKRMEKAMDEMYHAHRKNLEMLRKEGIISKDFYTFLVENHKRYNPIKYMQHLDPLEKGIKPSGAKVNIPNSGIEALTGGSEGYTANNAQWLYESSTSSTINRIFKNRANRSLGKMVKEHPDNPFGLKLQTGKPKKIPDDHTRLNWFDGGKRYSIIAPDEFAKNWISSEPLLDAGFANTAKWIFMAPILRAGATGLNPEFALTNPFRDIAYGWFTQHEAFHPFMPIGMSQFAKEAIKALPDVIGKKGSAKEYIQLGSGMEFLTQQGFLWKRPLGLKTGTARHALQRFQEIAGYLGQTSEMMTRVGLFNRYKAMGYSPLEAAHKARTYLDFAQGGNYTKAVDTVIPYLNASVQGTRGIAEAIAKDPKLATAKIAQVMAFSAGMSEWAQRLDPDMWEAVPSWEKRTGWIIPLGIKVWDKETGSYQYGYFKIPKDHGQIIFSMIGMQMMDAAMGRDIDWKNMGQAMLDSGPAITSGIPLISAIMTYANNKDFYRGKDLYKGRKVDAEFEAYGSTPEIYKDMGELLNMSPVRLEGATQKIWPNNVYTRMMQGAWAFSKNTLSKGDRTEIDKTLYQEIANFPGTKRYLRLTWPWRGDEVQLLKDANKFGVPTHDEEGSQLSRRVLEKNIDKEKIKENNQKNVNDWELDVEMEKLRFSQDTTALKGFFQEKLGKRPTDLDSLEVKRLITRAKKKVRKEHLRSPEAKAELKDLFDEYGVYPWNILKKKIEFLESEDKDRGLKPLEKERLQRYYRQRDMLKK